jgi:hypothetical protein
LTKAYVPAVSIGGTQVWNNGGASLIHYPNTRWTQEGWIGGDPQIAPRLDTGYLKSALLVPELRGRHRRRDGAQCALSGLRAKPERQLDGIDGRYRLPGSDRPPPAVGFALHTSGGDQRAYRSVVANAKALNSYPIAWSDSVTKVPVRPSDRPNWSADGAGAGGSTSRTAGALTWELAHHGSGGILRT